MTNRILIIGGPGFIGCDCCDWLVKEGPDMLCLDNFFTAFKQSSAYLLWQLNLEIMLHDVTLPLYVEVDQIFTPRDEDLTISSDGSQTCSFCHVGYLVEVLLRMMQTPNGLTGPISIGSLAESTMLEFAEEIIELTESASQVVFHPLPQDDHRRRKPDISATREAPARQPTVPLETGLEKTMACFRDLLDCPA